jgi:hypothetical protein
LYVDLVPGGSLGYRLIGDDEMTFRSTEDAVSLHVEWQGQPRRTLVFRFQDFPRQTPVISGTPCQSVQLWQARRNTLEITLSDTASGEVRVK